MNWIESVFGLSPDGGDGTTEMLIAVAIALSLAMVFSGRTLLARNRRVKRK